MTRMRPHSKTPPRSSSTAADSRASDADAIAASASLSEEASAIWQASSARVVFTGPCSNPRCAYARAALACDPQKAVFDRALSASAVSVGISWYSADPAKHAEVTGSRASYARTRANVVEAVRRGIRLNAGVVDVVQGQGIDAAIAELRALGVTSIYADRARGVGRAANGAPPVVSELCGRCGKGRAAIGMDGQLTPCVLGRFLIAGNVKETPLASLFAGQRWREILVTVPEQNACVSCTPGDSNDCQPSRVPE
jgi:MoaA/NifB/PqqE/SkfB family radical SAM enzyme